MRCNSILICMLVLKKLALLGAMEKPVLISSAELAGLISVSPQTAVRRLQELEREGLITRRPAGGGQRVEVTDRGVELLRREYLDYQAIFSRWNEIRLTGEVVTGLGEGKYYISLEGYRRQFQEKLGFTPFPGTLNLRLSPQSLGRLARLERGIRIEGFVSEKRTFGGGTCFPSLVQKGSQEVKGAVVMPDRSHYSREIIEVIAPVNLRERLGLADGSIVEIKVEMDTEDRK